MMNFNMDKWKSFRVGDLFDIKKPPVYHTRQVIEDESGVNYVVRTKFDNGVKYRVKLTEGMTSNPVGVISFGSENSAFFYQEEPWISGRDIYYVDTKFIESAYTCRFLTTCLTQITHKYDYNFGLFPKQLEQEVILLPATSCGNPDWDYMDQFMRSVDVKAIKAVETLQGLGDIRSSEYLDTSRWKDFRVGDLFDIHPTKAYKETNRTLFAENGVNPVVVNSGFNNGIGGYTNLDCTECAGVITFTDTAAKSSESFFFQDRDFVGYPHVQGMYGKTHSWTRLEGLFLASVLRATVTGRFDFIKKMTRDVISDLIIKLPATTAGDPDWNYMSEYMKGIERKAENSLSSLENRKIS